MTTLSLALPGSATTNLPQLPPSQLNLMPFHLAYTGPSPISTYFLPREIPIPSSSTPSSSSTEGAKTPVETITVAAFRGRRLQAHNLPLPTGYTGLVLSAPSPALASHTPYLVEVSDVSRSNKDRLAEVKDDDMTVHNGSGVRRSPRKRNSSQIEIEAAPAPKRRPAKARVMQKFSMDSDEDEIEDEEATQKAEPETTVSIDIVEQSETITENNSQLDLAITSSVIQTNLTINPTPSASLLSDSPIPSATNSQDGPPTLIDDPLPDDLPHFTLPIRMLKATATFNSFTLWNPDGPVDQGKDEYCRSLSEWISLGELLHAD